MNMEDFDRTKVSLRQIAHTKKLDKVIQEAANAVSKEFLYLLKNRIEYHNETMGAEDRWILSDCAEKGEAAIQTLITRISLEMSDSLTKGMRLLEQSQDGSGGFPSDTATEPTEAANPNTDLAATHVKKESSVDHFHTDN